MLNYRESRRMWFDVEGGWRGWFKAPLRGADSSPAGWGTDGTFLNGGGYAANSFGSHKRYQYEWGDSSTRQEAQFMKSLSDGTYGRGLIHFVEPTLYDRNILPARVADPSMALDDESASLVYGVDPIAVDTPNWQANLLPSRSAYYDLTNVTMGYRGEQESVYIPIPDDYTLYLGAFYTPTGTGGVFVRKVNLDGTESAGIYLNPIDASSSVIAVDSFADIRGVRLYIGKYGSRNASVTATAFIARLVKTDSILVDGAGYGEGDYGLEEYGGVNLSGGIDSGPWEGGMGHSGCRFVGKPTFVTNTGVNGGQIGFSATFQEVGSWIYG